MRSDLHRLDPTSVWAKSDPWAVGCQPLNYSSSSPPSNKKLQFKIELASRAYETGAHLLHSRLVIGILAKEVEGLVLGLL